jgi:hypothetical protein
VPGSCTRSLVGSRNCHTFLAETGRARMLNRQKWTLAELRSLLADAQGHQHRVFDAAGDGLIAPMAGFQIR